MVVTPRFGASGESAANSAARVTSLSAMLAAVPVAPPPPPAALDDDDDDGSGGAPADNDNVMASILAPKLRTLFSEVCNDDVSRNRLSPHGITT